MHKNLKKEPAVPLAESSSENFAEVTLFQQKKNDNPETPNETDLWKEVGEAILEHEIMNLRDQLHGILEQEPPGKSEFSEMFDLTESLDGNSLLEKLPDSSQEITGVQAPLPRIHVHNHKRAGNETTHLLYREQLKPLNGEQGEMDSTDYDEEWTMMEEALTEEDIIELRDRLQQIASSVSLHDYTLEEIENYKDGAMEPEDEERFREELTLNRRLHTDYRLSAEIEEALTEPEIISLRDSLKEITGKRNFHTREVSEIEAFLNGELDGAQDEVFAEEMINNKHLKKDVRLVKDVNDALSEGDIFELRDELQEIAGNIHIREKQSVIPLKAPRRKKRQFGIVAALLVCVLGISSLIRLNGGGENLYDEYYEIPVAVAPFRAASQENTPTLEQGFKLYTRKDFSGSLNYFENILRNDSGNIIARFYAGASYQNLNKLEDAIINYDRVIRHNDNLFVEQAEWYRALCYLGLHNYQAAESHLEAIIDRKSYYGKEALLLYKSLKKKEK